LINTQPLLTSTSTAIVTGASKGIGRSIALALATEGANVAICARGEEALRVVEKEIKKSGVNVFAAPCNVGNKKALDEFLDASKKNLGSTIFWLTMFPLYIWEMTMQPGKLLLQLM